MDLRKCLLTKNDCYKAGKKITPKGVMWHSTGANNPNIKRYVQPDDGKLGDNQYNNDWNRSGTGACVHAFIGLDKNGKVCTYQTLPWNHRGWHCGGSGNDRYISFEICEDDLKDKSYFEKVYKEAVELTAYLCKQYNLNPNGSNVIICHQDGYKLGIATNHSDIYHWFNKFGKDMNDVRKDVAAAMGKTSSGSSFNSSVSSSSSKKSISQIVDEVIAGKWGNGNERKNRLTNAGYDYDEVQSAVNKKLNGSSTTTSSKKSVSQIAKEVIAGKWGNGETRKKKLEAAGYNYSTVQAEVNKQLGSSSSSKKSIDTIAKEVIAGKWGNGETRKKKLEAAGYNYSTVQRRVNQMLK